MRLFVLALVGLITIPAMAQNQGQAQPKPPPVPSFTGYVVGAADDGSWFSYVDKTGAIIKMAVSRNTTYLSNKVEVRAGDVIRFGMDIRGTYAPDGSAEQVTGRGFASQLNVTQMQAFLDVSDAEWTVLKPKIDKIMALRRIAESRATNATQNGNNGNNGNGGNGNGNNPPPPRNPVQELQGDLSRVYFDQSMSADQLKTKLNSLRDTQDRARADLARQRSELIELITTRQEVLLVIMGVLE